MSAMRILKFPLKVDARQEVRLPAGFRILSIQVQYGIPVMWVACPQENAYSGPPVAVDLPIYCYMTGAEVDGSIVGGHIATVLLDEGQFVAHFFRGVVV